MVGTVVGAVLGRLRGLVPNNKICIFMHTFIYIQIYLCIYIYIYIILYMCVCVFTHADIT